MATFGALVLVGVVPLIPYVTVPPDARFAVAIAATLVTLFVVGALRSAVTALRWWKAGLEMLAVGACGGGIVRRRMGDCGGGVRG